MQPILGEGNSDFLIMYDVSFYRYPLFTKGISTLSVFSLIMNKCHVVQNIYSIFALVSYYGNFH